MKEETAAERRARYARQMRSRRVTVPARHCDCLWCTIGPRHDAALLIRRFNYASTPTMTRIA
jgi:hypothetical protein